MRGRIGHVLVVDDDPLNRRLLTASLEREGHRTSAAGDGLAALAALREETPDVILLDIVMPELDGLAVLEQIKQDAELRHIPVIVISGVDEADSVVRCIEMGAEDFLPKPFDPVILRARVNAGLNRKAVHDLERERVRDVFARFLPEPLVDQVLARTEGEPSIEAEQMTATVMFADLRGFTRFGEGRPVDDVIAALNRYHELMTDAILDNGGTLIDRMGDGIMAAFGAPIAHEDHADRGLAAAREMAGPKLGAFNAWLRERGVDDGFRMGIGLNSGVVMSGSVGSSRRLDYTVIGDTTNTASRIEGLTKEVGFSVLVSDETYGALRGLPPDDLVFVDEVEIRGRRSTVKLWGLEHREPEVTG
jgi:adenylate cyclase